MLYAAATDWTPLDKQIDTDEVFGLVIGVHGVFETGSSVVLMG
jgi:hypothetical protein